MKSTIRHAIQAARLRSKEPPRATESCPVLMSSPVIQTALSEIMNGDTLTIPDVMRTLHCKRDKAIRFTRRGLGRGVMKIGKSYVIPRSVFEEMIAELLAA